MATHARTHWIVKEPTAQPAGWEHGLPPAISPAEWPRHTGSGLPLVHGFTILVPEEYRAKGSERVALSYFHPGSSESYGTDQPRVRQILAGAKLSEREQQQPFYAALAAHVDAHHPATDRFTDVLDHDHAVVWHTAAELHGPRCPRPQQPLPDGIDGAAMDLDSPVVDEVPLFLTAVEPSRVLIQLGWPLHPVQCSADDLQDQGFGQLVMEIETDVGGSNYGDGNCQIDLENGLLDWACT
jgi:hypothetical protein